jgi:hypothetical protein
MLREKHKMELPLRLNIEVNKDGGLTRSSEEAFVMRVEQRG